METEDKEVMVNHANQDILLETTLQKNPQTESDR